MLQQIQYSWFTTVKPARVFILLVNLLALWSVTTRNHDLPHPSLLPLIPDPIFFFFHFSLYFFSETHSSPFYLFSAIPSFALHLSSFPLRLPSFSFSPLPPSLPLPLYLPLSSLLPLPLPLPFFPLAPPFSPFSPRISSLLPSSPYPPSPPTQSRQQRHSRKISNSNSNFSSFLGVFFLFNISPAKSIFPHSN